MSADSDERVRIATLSREVVNEDDQNQRDRKAILLFESVAAQAAAGRGDNIPESTIDDLIVLVGNPSNNVIACRTLAEIGSRAHRAIPAVEQEIRRLQQLVEAESMSNSVILQRPATLVRMTACLEAISDD